MRHLNSWIIIFFIATSSFAWAWPPTYGAEFEIATEKTAHEGQNFDYSSYPPSKSIERAEQLRYVQHLRQRCLTLGCKVVEVSGKWDTDFRVEYPDGWWWKVSYDPSCVEITFKPSTLETIKEKAALINEHIFGTGRELGMSTQPEQSNHFNMGIRSSFNDDPKEFLKFYVDYANNPALTVGGLGNDIYNAPPLAALGAEQREALQLIVQEVEAGHYRTIAEVARAIQEKVYTKSYYEPWGGPHHYQAFGLKHVNKANLAVQDAPFELRSMWAQPDAETFVKIAELMEARIQYLRTTDQPLIYTQTSKYSFTPEEIKTRLFFYIEETGLKFKDYEFFLKGPVAKAKLSPLVDKKAKIENRIKDLLAYSDLLTTSSLARKTALEIMRHPDAKGNPEIEKLKARLMKEIGGKKNFLQTLFNYGESNDVDSRKKALLSRFLRDAEKAQTVFACEQVFAY